MEIKIRPLTVNDNRLLVNLIKRLAVETSEEWIGSVVKQSSGKVSESENDNSGEIFALIIDKLIGAYTGELTKLFASLLNITEDEYNKLPFDTDMEIIEQIKKAPEFSSFFQKACVAFNLQKIIGNITKNVKNRFVSLTN